MRKTISKNNLKANMFEIFRQLETSGDELIVTDGEVPVLKIVPIKPKPTAEELFGAVQGRVRYHEDINMPTITEWDNA